MSIIRFPDRRARALEPIHPTAPRVGIFAIAARRARSTGPQAHLHCYIADEERAVWRKVLRALSAFGMIVGSWAIAITISRALLGAAIALGWFAP